MPNLASAVKLIIPKLGPKSGSSSQLILLSPSIDYGIYLPTVEKLGRPSNAN